MKLHQFENAARQGLGYCRIGGRKCIRSRAPGPDPQEFDGLLDGARGHRRPNARRAPVLYVQCPVHRYPPFQRPLVPTAVEVDAKLKSDVLKKINRGQLMRMGRAGCRIGTAAMAVAEGAHVEMHRVIVMRKLGARNFADLMRLAAAS